MRCLPDLLSAFRATLEEISDSTLLIHAVDISNPRWVQQVQSVKRILAELKLAEIPSILALNKADLVDPETVEAAVRQAGQLDNGETVVISAIKPSTLSRFTRKSWSGIGP